jgi:hypothetical protein
VFVGCVPREVCCPQDGLVPIDNRIFSSWAHRTFTGVVLAKLRVDASNQSMGYGFLKFDSSENASEAIQRGRAAFDAAYVEIKATAKRNVNENRNNQSGSERGSKEVGEAHGAAAQGPAASGRGVEVCEDSRWGAAVAEAAARRTAGGDEGPPPVPHAQLRPKSMLARLAALEAAAARAGLLPASKPLTATAAAAAAAAAGIPSGGEGTKPQLRWAELAVRVAVLGRRWPFDFVLVTVNYVFEGCELGRRDLRVLLHSRRAARRRSPARFRGASFRIIGTGSC